MIGRILSGAGAALGLAALVLSTPVQAMNFGDMMNPGKWFDGKDKDYYDGPYGYPGGYYGHPGYGYPGYGYPGYGPQGYGPQGYAPQGGNETPPPPPAPQ